MQIWDLEGPSKRPMVDRFLLRDGSFNMQAAALKYIKLYQQGWGICSVSEHYSERVREKVSCQLASE